MIGIKTSKSEFRIGAKPFSKCWFWGHDWSAENKVKGDSLTMTFADVCIKKRCCICKLELTSYRKVAYEPVLWEISKREDQQ